MLAVAALLNIFSGHLLAIINNISVWWHVAGVAVVVAILAFVPKTHQALSFVFGDKVNNSGLRRMPRLTVIRTGSWCCRSASC